MKRKIPNRRLIFLLGVLLVIVLMGAANSAHIAWLDHELQAVAEVERARLNDEGMFMPGQDSVAEVATAKQWGVFGPAFGKVSVYTRTSPENGTPLYGMLNLFYERRGSEWVQVESGYCASDECVPGATRAFAAAE
jgi:hypothetical protein